MPEPTRVLVAGLGNVLRGDDGFGPAVVRALDQDGGLPPAVRTVEVGIGGIALVHELMEGCDALVMVDAVDVGGEPGTLHVIEPAIPIPEEVTPGGFAADMHEIVPARVLALAGALGVLPPVVRLVGCQPAEVDEFSLELTSAVARAVPEAVETIRRLAADLAARESAA